MRTRKSTSNTTQNLPFKVILTVLWLHSEQRKFGDGVTLGYINRLQIQNEGGWTQLTYPRSRWLAAQLGNSSTSGSAEEGKQPEAAAEATQALEEEEAVDYKRAEDIYGGIAASADMSEVHGNGEAPAKLEPVTRSGDSAADALFHRTCANVREHAAIHHSLRSVDSLNKVRRVFRWWRWTGTRSRAKSAGSRRGW